MGQHAEDALNDILDEEDYRARKLPDNEPVHPEFGYRIPTLENIEAEMALLERFLK